MTSLVVFKSRVSILCTCEAVHKTVPSFAVAYCITCLASIPGT